MKQIPGRRTQLIATISVRLKSLLPRLHEAMQEKGFVGWLRNLPQRSWAMCVPYELGGSKPFYPDFIIVREKDKGGFEVDILEPHDDSRSDTWAKAKGLAVFADEHGMDFARLIIGRKKGQQVSPNGRLIFSACEQGTGRLLQHISQHVVKHVSVDGWSGLGFPWLRGDMQYKDGARQ